MDKISKLSFSSTVYSAVLLLTCLYIFYPYETRPYCSSSSCPSFSSILLNIITSIAAVSFITILITSIFILKLSGHKLDHAWTFKSLSLLAVFFSCISLLLCLSVFFRYAPMVQVSFLYDIEFIHVDRPDSTSLIISGYPKEWITQLDSSTEFKATLYKTFVTFSNDDLLYPHVSLELVAEGVTLAEDDGDLVVVITEKLSGDYLIVLEASTNFLKVSDFEYRSVLYDSLYVDSRFLINISL
ncbi:hypothetical protein P9112_011393 [Eukaryota sp. TZLM1-RC]